MGQIEITGGPVCEVDGPVSSLVLGAAFYTCPHCQRSIREVCDMSSPVGRRLESDYSCPACGGQPVCVRCGELLHAGHPCPGPYRVRARMGEFLPP